MLPAILQDVPNLQAIPPSLLWPVKTCAHASAACYVLSIITGNLSQVDRIWTFMPTIYTAYFALLPIWPRVEPFPLFPFTPEAISDSLATNWNKRALFMFALQVSNTYIHHVIDYSRGRASSCGCSGTHAKHGIVKFSLPYPSYRLSYNTWRRGLFSL